MDELKSLFLRQLVTNQDSRFFAKMSNNTDVIVLIGRLMGT